MQLIPYVFYTNVTEGVRLLQVFMMMVSDRCADLLEVLATVANPGGSTTQTARNFMMMQFRLLFEPLMHPGRAGVATINSIDWVVQLLHELETPAAVSTLKGRGMVGAIVSKKTYEVKEVIDV